MKLGIFGGTFDPPHLCHLVAAQDALDRLGLDRVILVPAATPPHKLERTITPGEFRLEMLRAAVANDARLEVDDVELRRTGPSWTVDTLRTFRDRWPSAELYLILGMDQFIEFDTWREPDVIAGLARLAVLSRAGTGADASDRWIPVPVTRIDITSTEIRERVATGRPIRYLVPEAVESLIERHGLYRVEGPAPGTGPASKG